MSFLDEDSDLTEKQKLFCEYYLVDSNGLQAALKAGYSETCPGEQAYENLNKPQIKAYLKKRRSEIFEKLEVTQERVLREYAKLGFSNMENYVTWNDGSIVLKNSAELSSAETAAVCEITETRSKDSGVTVKLKLHDKKGALDSIGRHLGMFVDNTNINLNVDSNDARSQLFEKFNKGKDVGGDTTSSNEPQPGDSGSTPL